MHPLMRGRRRIALWAVAALLAVNAALLATQPGLALPRSLGSYFFGSKLVRAEVVVRDGGIREFRLDRGRLRKKSGSSLVLREADGSIVLVPVAPSAVILLNGKQSSFGALRRGMTVTTVREGDAPAAEVRATARS
jgi:hypothetical protein